MNRYATCIICDDIRQEVGGKFSLMGVYGGEMTVSPIPALLSRLCFSAQISTPRDEPFRSLEVRFEFGEQLISQITIPAEELDNLRTNALAQGDDAEPVERYSIAVNHGISPFVIESDGVVRVIFIADGKEHVAAKLRVRGHKQEA